MLTNTDPNSLINTPDYQILLSLIDKIQETETNSLCGVQVPRGRVAAPHQVRECYVVRVPATVLVRLGHGWQGGYQVTVLQLWV